MLSTVWLIAFNLSLYRPGSIYLWKIHNLRITLNLKFRAREMIYACDKN